MDKFSPRSDYLDVNGIRLHYLDWGGHGSVLLFLAGMGCSAYIFSTLAPRFTDKFHVLALDRRGHGDSDYPETGYDADTLTEDLHQFLDALKIEQVILAGHSFANIELSHFSVLYPERVLKLVYLDAVYDNTSPEYKTVMGQNPLPKMIPAWPENDPETIDDYIAISKRLYPAIAAIWGETMAEQTKHMVRITAEGTVVDKMSNTISKTINDTFNNYVPKYSQIQAPVLSFFAIRDGSDFLSSEYMTEEQKSQVIDYFTTTLLSYKKNFIEQFQRQVPHAVVVEIPNGHHYCFIKQEELVFNEMMNFLLE